MIHIRRMIRQMILGEGEKISDQNAQKSNSFYAVFSSHQFNVPTTGSNIHGRNAILSIISILKSNSLRIIEMIVRFIPSRPPKI